LRECLGLWLDDRRGAGRGLAREPDGAQLPHALVARALGGAIFGHRSRGVGLLLLAPLERGYGASVVGSGIGFLGHADKTRAARDCSIIRGPSIGRAAACRATSTDLP